MTEGPVPFEVEAGEDGVRVSGLIERDAKGAPAITSVTVSCATEQNMSQLLRRLRLGEVVQTATVPTLSGPAPATPSGPPHGGRQPLDDDLMRRVAMAYLQQTAPGQPTGAMRRVAAEFGRPEGTVRSWIARARTRGWLGPSRRGRRGAEPGPRLATWKATP